jgi:hypothetical protein
MKNTLLEEIKRIHSIIGIEPKILLKEEEEINEDAFSTELARIFAKFFVGVEKSLVVGGRNYAKAEVKAIVKKLGTEVLEIEEKEVVRELTKAAIAADRKIIANISSDIFGEMQKLGSKNAKTKYFAEVKTRINDILPPNEAKEVVKGVRDKIGSKKQTTSTNTTTNTTTNTGGKTSTGGKTKPDPNNVLKPDPNANVPSTPDVLPSNASEIIAATAASSPEAKAFMEQVKLLGFDEKITKILQLEYSKFYNLSAAELIKEGNALVKQLNEKNYGWIKRGWSKVTDNPSEAIGKAGKASYKAILWYTVIGLAMTGSAIVYAIKNKVENATGVKGSDILPKIDVDLTNTNNQTTTYGFDDNGISQYLIKIYPNTPVSAYDLKQVTSPDKVYLVKLKTGSPELKFKYENGNYTEVK